MKRFLTILGKLSVSLTWKMFRALISKPLLILPSTWATAQSFLYSEMYFEESHGGSGVANAFRHAAWNILIAKNCNFYTTKEKAIEWAKFLTDLHEECFPNEAFDHEMDLHNNAFGRNLFDKIYPQKVKKTNQLMRKLFEESNAAIGLENEMEIKNYPNNMVFYDSVNS